MTVHDFHMFYALERSFHLATCRAARKAPGTICPTSARLKLAELRQARKVVSS